ncbi:constitutive coactivator of peroxisome proliferator-activated receptor gamma [Spea bombifrons]|uniref:constitutive coactivator of peroxisome proliferator-activated receptor gamma n=1 Tax=Spea bombifrons TaxID=233779 RepID=UPI00234BEA0E|nr:constitutive coactivator of peroxisome proliferator-activated receptor gamma [Spea bombifrons]
MGIKGLQSFAQNSPNVCNMINIKTLAHRQRSLYPGCTPTIVVDAMGCLRTWYTPNAWVHGGQWKEYLCSLQKFITAFQSAGIRLVFIFDGVVEQKKRAEWAQRRLRDNHEISKIFSFIKCSGKQPDRNMFFIPSGISTFTRFALKALGQEVVCSRVEGDYEVARYGLQHQCLGILGEDSDYLIFNTVPYFSINKLQLHNLVTLMYSREGLCDSLGLCISDLPLLACLLGNDTVPMHMVEDFQKNCLTLYRSKGTRHNRRTQVIQAVAAFIAHIQMSPHYLSEVEKYFPNRSDLQLLQKGVKSYILPQQTSPWLSSKSQCPDDTKVPETPVCPDKDVVQIVLDHHYKGDNTMICNVLCLGETECSNTLEDDTDSEIPGQALVYRRARQHIYAVLLGTGNGSQETCPVVKEWYVYPGNPLDRPTLVQAVPLSTPGGTPGVRSLLLGTGPDIQRLRFHTCMACFDADHYVEELSVLEPPLAATCCLLIYLALQVESLSLEDVDAFLSQAVCLPGKSAGELKCLQVYFVDSRAVHLAFLYLRGIVTLMGANSACGYPFKMMDLMPWNTFDGKLFHQKYLHCHKGSSVEEILDGNESLIAQFKKLKAIVYGACIAKRRTLKAQRREHYHLQDQRQSAGGQKARGYQHSNRWPR